MTELERNKRLATRWLGLVSDGEVETLCRLSALDWRMYGGPPGLPSGHVGLRALFGHIGPVEQKWTVDDVIAQGDRVVVRATNCCLQEEFLGVPARGKRQVFTATVILPHRRPVGRRSLTECRRPGTAAAAGDADRGRRGMRLSAVRRRWHRWLDRRRAPAGPASAPVPGLRHRPPDRPEASMTIEDWTRIADRFVRVLETGDVADLERLYHPDLRFTVRTAGTAMGRDDALANFRQMWTLLQDVAVEVVSRQATTSGFLVQQVLNATGPSGQRVQVPMCMIFTLRAGLIVGIDEYFDSAAVAPLLDEVAA